MGRIFTSVVLFLLLLQYVQSNSDEQTPDSPTQTPDIYPHQKYLIEQILTERQEGVTYINPTTQQPYPKTRYNSQEITTNHREQLETFIKHQKSPKNNDNQETEHITTFMEDRYMTAQLTEAITLCQSTNSRDKEKGFNILKNSVNNKKNPIALHQLALQYQLGIVVERNFKMAFELLSEAALFGYPPAQRELAFMYDTGKGTLRDSAKALVYYSIAEKGGDIESALVLGYKYATGNSVVKTCSQAAKYYRAVGEYVTKKITAQGYDNSGYFHFTDLKEYEETGDLLKHHEADIVEYMEFAADTGDPMYQIQVGLMYLYGVYDHEIDYNRAREYFELAHIQEIGRATALIGSLYEEGYGVPQSNKTALEYYQLAHDNGNVHGTYYLGRAYLRGTGVEKDYKLALQYLTEASNQMHIGATVELAKMYFEGNGVSYNYPQAAQLFNTAAVHDNAEAKYYFAKMNHHGLGVPERCTTAIHWYQAVANKGDWIYDFDEALEAYLNENYDTALILYEKLAAKGFKMAQFNAAWIFDNKLHSESYLQEMTAPVAAFEYYKLAAGQGNEHAHLRLGDFYYYGDEDGGIQVSYPLSISHYLTISKSNAQAMYNLGYIHQHGIGVISDRSVAHDFYSAALEADSNSVLACWLSLLSLGFDYVKEKYNNNAIHEVLPEFWEYMTYSSIFTEFLDQLEKDLKELEDELEKELQEMEKDKKLKQSSEYSFLDEDTDFGYKLDTILMALLCVTIAIVLLFRQGFIQVQVERR